MRCEDFPCCGHEDGDCDGSKYGSDADIKQAVYDRYTDPDFNDDHPYEGTMYDMYPENY